MSGLKLTKAQREALVLVEQGDVSYHPGRTSGARSSWTRYSYEVRIGGKFSKRTKSVDKLMDLGLVDIVGSGTSTARVVLTTTGAAVCGVKGTKLAAVFVKRGQRVFARNGAEARVTEATGEYDIVHLRLSVGDFCFTETYRIGEAVLVAPIPTSA